MNAQGTGYYGAPDTTAQLAQDMFGSVQAGGQYSSNPVALQHAMTPTDQMQIQSIASGAAQSPWISQSMAQQFLQGNYGVANQLGSSAQGGSGWIDAVTQQAAQGSLADPSTGQGPSPWTPPTSAAWGGGGGARWGRRDHDNDPRLSWHSSSGANRLGDEPGSCGLPWRRAGRGHGPRRGQLVEPKCPNQEQGVGGIFGGGGTVVGRQHRARLMLGRGMTPWVARGRAGWGRRGGSRGRWSCSWASPLANPEEAPFGDGGIASERSRQQTTPGAAFTNNPLTGAPSALCTSCTAGYQGLNTTTPTRATSSLRARRAPARVGSAVA